MLCMKHDLPCMALMTGALAATRYDPSKEASDRDPSIAELRIKREDILDNHGLGGLIEEAEISLNQVLQSAD